MRRDKLSGIDFVAALSWRFRIVHARAQLGWTHYKVLLLGALMPSRGLMLQGICRLPLSGNPFGVH